MSRLSIYMCSTEAVLSDAERRTRFSVGLAAKLPDDNRYGSDYTRAFLRNSPDLQPDLDEALEQSHD